MLRRISLPRTMALLAVLWAGAAVADVASGAGELSAGSLSAGSFTVAADGANAFSVPIPRLSKEQAELFALGREKFNEAWVVAPEPNGVWGLGPTFNEDRCSSCHENNGRARAPENGKQAERGMLVRLSIPGETREGAPNPHPSYGDQLQNRGVKNRVPAEGNAIFTYTEREVGFADGEKVLLRVPKIEFAALQFGDIGKETMLSPRVAPALVGVGLLEAIDESTILATAKEQEKFGLAGKANYVWDYEINKTVLGRFGWKANQPHLRQQIATAFLADIGATSYVFPEENCPPIQKQCLDLPSASKCGGQGGCTGNNYRPEVTPSRLNSIALYLHALAVPASRNIDDPAVNTGRELFTRANCSVCHIPVLKTGDKAEFPAAANVVIHAYTDLLLHDMGDELADGRPDFKAGGAEWRTPPLWGLGLLPVVSGHSELLHDGRARNVVEAILWHGGQAKAARESFKAMSKEDRAALVKFVESL